MLDGSGVGKEYSGERFSSSAMASENLEVSHESKRHLHGVFVPIKTNLAPEGALGLAPLITVTCVGQRP